MSKKYTVIILVLLALTLSACGGAPQSASTEVPTPGKKQPKASATVDVNAMASIEIFGTQTAEAALALGTPIDGLPAFDEGTATLPAGFEQPTVDPNGGVLPTVTPQVAQPQPTVHIDKPATYTLQKGEFIFCLARRFNVDVDQTLALNGLFDSETLQPGLTVKIPASGNFSGTRALRAHPATYTVRADDTIYSIACLYGDVDPLNIAAVNGLPAPFNLTSGAQIQIP